MPLSLHLLLAEFTEKAQPLNLCITLFAGVDLRAFEKSSPSDRGSGVMSNDSTSEQSSDSGWMPDWTRSALDEVFGPLAETATMLYMSRGQSDEGQANIVGR